MSFINCHSTFCSSKTPLWVTNIPNEQWLGNNMLQCDKYITVYKTGRKEWANAGPDMITRRRLVPWKVNVKVYDHQSKYEFVVSYLLFMCFPVRPHPIRWTMVMSPTINYGWLLPSTRSLSINRLQHSTLEQGSELWAERIGGRPGSAKRFQFARHCRRASRRSR